MDCNGGKQGNEIPWKSPSVIFVEDMMNYVLQKYSLQSTLFSPEQQGKGGASTFDNILRMAADFIYKTFGFETEQTYNFILQYNAYNMEWFAYYAEHVKNSFARCPHPEGFLHYAVHLAHLAAKFHAQGFEEAPRMAVCNIVQAMDHDFRLSRAEILDMVVKKYVAMQRLSIETVEEPQPYINEEFIAQAQKTSMRVPHVHRCKVVTENIQRVRIEENEMDEGIVMPSSSQSFSEFESTSNNSSDPHNETIYKVKICFSVSVSGSSRGEPTNLDSQERYSVDSSENEHSRRKKPRLDHGV